MDFMRGNRLRYVGAIATVALTVTIGFLTPRVLGGTVDAIVDHLNGTDNPLNFFGAMNDYLYARGGREYLLARLFARPLDGAGEREHRQEHPRPAVCAPASAAL